MTTNCLRQYSSSSSGSPKIVARRPKKEGDEFSAYRHLCEVRMRRLERYKKAKSFCSLEDEAACSSSLQQQMSSAGSSGLESLRSTISSTIESIPPSEMEHCHSSSMSDSLPSQARSSDGSHRPASQVSSANSVVESQFEVLREKMISLMENDVQLLQKLLKLGETIQELRNSRPVHRASSETSLASSLGEEEEENDDWRPLEQRDNFSASMSAITRLYVDDEPPNVQYFSRKNSVLRIPIPPRSSNRMLGNKRIPRRPSELAKSGRLHLEDSGHSSGSSSSDSPPQHSPNAISDSLSSRSTLSDRLPVFEEIKIPRVSAGHRVSLPVGTVLEKEHRYTKYSRHESSDSGIRDDGSKSPPLIH